MLDDVGAIKMNVFHERPAIFAVKNNVLLLSGWPAPFDHDSDRIGRPLRRVWNIRRDEERLAFPHDMIDDSIALPDPDFDVAL